LLAIAVMGTWGLHQFRDSVSQELGHTGLNIHQTESIISNSRDFAATQVPEGFSERAKKEATDIIHSSFIRSFDTISRVSAIAAWFSALLALFFLKPKTYGSSGSRKP
jgi:hypothetical protein